MKVIYYEVTQARSFHLHAHASMEAFYIPDKEVIIFKSKYGTFSGSNYGISRYKKEIKKAKEIAFAGRILNPIWAILYNARIGEVKTLTHPEKSLDDLIKDLEEKERVDKRVSENMDKLLHKVDPPRGTYFYQGSIYITGDINSYLNVEIQKQNSIKNRIKEEIKDKEYGRDTKNTLLMLDKVILDMEIIKNNGYGFIGPYDENGMKVKIARNSDELRMHYYRSPDTKRIVASSLLRLAIISKKKNTKEVKVKKVEYPKGNLTIKPQYWTMYS